jgi:predicted PurR-regulated permease PerM
MTASATDGPALRRDGTIGSATQEESTTFTPTEHRWITRTLPAIAILAWTSVGLVFVWLLGHVPQAVLVFSIGSVVGFAVGPLVSLFARVMPRGFAVALGYVVGLGLVVGAMTAFAATASAQLGALVSDVPADVERLQQSIEPLVVPVLSPFGVTADSFKGLLDGLTSSVQGIGRAASTDLLGTLNRGFTLGASAVLALILSIYLTSNAPGMTRWLRQNAPPGQAQRLEFVLAETVRVIRGYVLGTLAMATLVGVLVGAGMALLGVRYALLLGVLAFFMEFIPFVGVLVSAAACLLVALGQGPLIALLVLGYFVVVHVLEGDVIGPRVMGRAIGIHPVLALLAFVAGTEMFGIWGALFGAPVAGLAQLVAVTVWRGSRASPQPLEPALAGQKSIESPPPLAKSESSA